MKRKFFRALAGVLLTAALLLPALVSCAPKAQTLMTLEKDGETYRFSANHYRLMLSTVKGACVISGETFNGHTAAEDEFWDAFGKFDGKTEQTRAEYYQDLLLTDCKNYLAAAYLFDFYDLSLSDAQKKENEEKMEELVRVDGEGSKNKLNGILADYGVNYDLMKEYFDLQSKLETLKSHLFSLAMDDVKTEFMEANYVHFRQIFLPAFRYVNVTDKNGDVVYFTTSTGTRICYDTDNGVPDLRSGTAVTDENGDTVYFVNDGTYSRIAYNRKTGVALYELTGDGSAYKTEELTVGELAELQTEAEELMSSLSGREISEEEFDALITERSGNGAEEQLFPDGRYWETGIDYSAFGNEYQYMETIVQTLLASSVGDVAMITAPDGYHIIRKYDFTDRAYALEENEVWFENFEANLSSELILRRCAPLLDGISVNEAVLDSLPGIKEVPVNFFYH